MRKIVPFSGSKGARHVYGRIYELLAVDPGKYSGWAFFSDQGLLEACGTGFPEYAEKMVRKTVVEVPQVYPQHPVPPQDLVTLSFTAGRFVGQVMGEVWIVHPHEWKGNLPKEVCANRVRSKLSSKELLVLVKCEGTVPVKQMHNVLDAIGIGLFFLKRGP
jgi:hypothetical protein